MGRLYSLWVTMFFAAGRGAAIRSRAAMTTRATAPARAAYSTGAAKTTPG